jgi:hypothetical protein
MAALVTPALTEASQAITPSLTAALAESSATISKVESPAGEVYANEGPKLTVRTLQEPASTEVEEGVGVSVILSEGFRVVIKSVLSAFGAFGSTEARPVAT